MSAERAGAQDEDDPDPSPAGETPVIDVGLLDGQEFRNDELLVVLNPAVLDPIGTLLQLGCEVITSFGVEADAGEPGGDAGDDMVIYHVRLLGTDQSYGGALRASGNLDACEADLLNTYVDANQPALGFVAESVDRNWIRSIDGHLTEPDDPLYKRQWALNNRGSVHNAGNEVFYDRNNDGAFDNGDTIYRDTDGSGSFTAGDTVLRQAPGAPAPPAANAALKPFPADVRHQSLAQFGSNPDYDEPETVYKDNQAPGTAGFGVPNSEVQNPPGTVVLTADDRLTPFQPPNGGAALPPGKVMAGDADDCRTAIADGAPRECLFLLPFMASSGAASLGIVDADIDAPQAWEHGTDCSAVRVAVIDTGVDFTHPDLMDNRNVDPDLLNPSGRTYAGMFGYVDSDTDPIKRGVQGNNRFDGGEIIYLDTDGMGTVAPGDRRMTALPAGPGGVPPELAPGIVAVGDRDVGNPMRRFVYTGNRTVVMYRDANNNQRWDPAEDVYDDRDWSWNVSEGDVRLRVAGFGARSIVLAGDGDVAVPPRRLAFFRNAANIMYQDADGDMMYSEGGGSNEGVYFDRNLNGTVTLADLRIRAATSPPAPAAHAGLPAPALVKRVMMGMMLVPEADVGSALRAFAPPQVPPDPATMFYERFVDINGDKWFTKGEYAYRDRVIPVVNGKYVLQVDAGDERLIPIPAGPGNNPAMLPAGLVAAADRDVGVPLIEFPIAGPVNELYHDANSNSLFDAFEGIYDDRDNNGKINIGDGRRLAPAGSAEGNNTNVVAGDSDVVVPARALRRFPVDLRNSTWTDQRGHGTGVASVIAARGNNAKDISGVCWTARLISLQTNMSDSSTLGCMEFIKDLPEDKRPRVVNISFGGYGYSRAQQEAISPGLRKVLFVIAAGNDGRDNTLGDNEDQGAQNPWESVYDDSNAPAANQVSVGDTRRSRFGNPIVGLGSAAAVGAGNADLGRALTPFRRFEMFVDRGGPPNGRFDARERAYRDNDLNGVVSINDLRLGVFRNGAKLAGRARVVRDDPDIGQRMRGFGADDEYIDIGVPEKGTIPRFFDGSGPAFPASLRKLNLIRVGATNDRDRLAVFSNYTEFTVGCILTVDCAAPGENMLVLRSSSLFARPTSADPIRTAHTSGTSFASPLVAGLAAHLMTRPGFTQDSVSSVISRVLGGYSPQANSDRPHGVDPRPGVRGSVTWGSTAGGTDRGDGRARMISGDDFGDHSAAGIKTLLADSGARHEDIGEEWLGREQDLPSAWFDPPLGALVLGPRASDVSPEFDAKNSGANPKTYPDDPDARPNIPDRDRHNDGVLLQGPFVFSRPGAAPARALVRVFVQTTNNMIQDADNGRYPATNVGAVPGPLGLGAVTHAVEGVHASTDDKHVWVNGWFDWNRNGDFGDPGEHVFMVACNPAMWGLAPFRQTAGVLNVQFNMPEAPGNVSPGAILARFRLDYGENSGQPLNPALPHNIPGAPGAKARFWDDPDGLPLGNAVLRNLYESMEARPPALYRSEGVAQFGEVEDYVIPACCFGDADRSGRIDFMDITAVLANWGTSYGPSSGLGDSDCDGSVSFPDVLAALSGWLTECPLPE